MPDPKFNTSLQQDLVKFLAESYPRALRESGRHGDTPIAAAQKQEAPEELIALLTTLDKDLKDLNGGSDDV